VRIGMVGLGRMGMNMARRLLRGNHEVVAYNRSFAKTEEIMREGASGAPSLEAVVEQLTPPRVVWLMLPAGTVVDEHLADLKRLLTSGDLVVEGGNTHYRDDLRRFHDLATLGIRYVDAGVSGGVWGLENGYCIMLGGDPDDVRFLGPVLDTLASPTGHLYCGFAGAGHFVKMIHNGIEYGMMQAYGEGFALLESSQYKDSLNYASVARLWNRGSVIRSWLLELLESAFADDGRLQRIRGYVEDSGEGRWAVEQALETGVAAPVITLSLMQRFLSRQQDRFSDKVVAALRREFGGHSVLASGLADES